MVEGRSSFLGPPGSDCETHPNPADLCDDLVTIKQIEVASRAQLADACMHRDYTMQCGTC